MEKEDEQLESEVEDDKKALIEAEVRTIEIMCNHVMWHNGRLASLVGFIGRG